MRASEEPLRPPRHGVDAEAGPNDSRSGRDPAGPEPTSRSPPPMLGERFPGSVSRLRGAQGPYAPRYEDRDCLEDPDDQSGKLTRPPPWLELAERKAQNVDARVARRTVRPGKSPTGPDEAPATEYLPPHLRLAKPTQVEVFYDMRPGAEFVAVPFKVFDAIRTHSLKGVQFEILMAVIQLWKCHELGDRFIVDTDGLGEWGSVKQRTVSDAITALADAGLIVKGTGGYLNRTWVDVAPLRKLVSGTTTPLGRSARGLKMPEAWGWGPDRPRGYWFFAVPMYLIELLLHLEISRPSRVAAYWLLRECFRRRGQRYLAIDTAKMAADLNTSTRTVRRWLQELARPPTELIVRITRSSRPWGVDVSPMLEEIRDPEPNLRPSHRAVRQPREGS